LLSIAAVDWLMGASSAALITIRERNDVSVVSSVVPESDGQSVDVEMPDGKLEQYQVAPIG
jgi:hypothetical protein